MIVRLYNATLETRYRPVTILARIARRGAAARRVLTGSILVL